MVESTLTAMLGAKLDQNMKFALLDWIDERPVTLIDKMDTDCPPVTEEQIERLIKDEIDYIVCDSMLEQDLLERCREEAEMVAKQEGLMREAGFGRGGDYQKDKKVRGDKFIWLSTHIDGGE